ncbi:MAG: NAD(P)-dependent oxidoreductase [Lachnospiraceae bacterium]|nr:NAD(P)-dependent oxidoreductase [Lachnospiraceae bacterium]
MKKAIITGPTGVVGIALVEYLIKQNVAVTAVCRSGSKRISRLPKSESLTIIECDLTELSKLSEMIDEEQDVFYHLAWDGTFGDARNATAVQVQNIQYTLDAVEAAAKLGCKRFVGAGSQAEYGRVEGMLDAMTPVFPENGYGMAKLCAGQMSRLRCEQLGIEHVWTRILSVYGPGDGEKTLVSSLIRKFLSGEVPACTKGEQIWDYLYSKDAARALYLLGDKGGHGKTYCIGSGDAESLADYIRVIRDIVNPDMEIGFGEIPYSEKQVMHLCADIEELRQDTGFAPQYTFEQGIVETVDWIKGSDK